MSLQDHSLPAPGQAPDPTASFAAASDEIAASILARLGESPEGAATSPAYQVPVQTAPPEPVVPVTVPPSQEPSGDVAKLLARLADLESAVALARRPDPTPEQRTPAGLDPRSLHVDAVSALQGAGLDVGVITRQLVAHAMGDQAPAELRAQVAAGREVSGLGNVVRQLQGQVVELQNQLRLTSVHQDLRTAATGVDSSKHPAVAAMAKTNPAWVDQALRDLVTADARANLSNPAAQPLTAPVALQRLEARLQPLYAAFTPAATPPVTAASAAAPIAAPAAPALLTGAPSPATPAQATTWEQKTDAVLADVLKKHGLL